MFYQRQDDTERDGGLQLVVRSPVVPLGSARLETDKLTVSTSAHIILQQGGNGETKGGGNINTSRIRDVIQEGTLIIT